MINEFLTKWQLWPNNVITQILQSLYNFISTLANPDWKPPQESKEFINALRGQATKEVETLAILDEEKLENNPLYSSLTALENVGGVYTEIAQNLNQNLLQRSTITNGPQVNLLGATSNQFRSEVSHHSSGSMMQSIRQGMQYIWFTMNIWRITTLYLYLSWNLSFI